MDWFLAHLIRTRQTKSINRWRAEALAEVASSQYPTDSDTRRHYQGKLNVFT